MRMMGAKARRMSICILKKMVLNSVSMFDESWVLYKYGTGISLQIVGC